MEENKGKLQGSAKTTQDSNDTILNLTSKLFSNNQPGDLNSLMEMATNLVSNEKLMNSVKDLAKGAPSTTQGLRDSQSTALLQKKVAESILQLAELREDVQDIKKQNEEIRELLLSLKSKRRRR